MQELMQDLKDQRIRYRKERMINVIQFIAGIFVGVAVGVVIMSLVVIAGDAKAERERKKRNDDRRSSKTDC